MSDLFVSAIEAIYAAAPDPALWPPALQAIADMFGDVGAILIWRRDDGAFGTVVSQSLVRAQAAYVENGWAAGELRAIRTAERGYFFSGEPFTDRHLCSEDEIRTDPVYTQFCTQYGMGWFGAVAVSPDPRIGVALSVQRNSRLKPPFSDAELESIGRIGRHVEQSLRLGIRLLDAEFSNLGLGHALARLGIGVFALDALCRVVFKNEKAEAFLGKEVWLVDGRLRVGAGKERVDIDQEIARSVRGEPETLKALPKSFIIKRSRSDRPLVMYILPIPAHSAAAEILTHTRAIVLFIDADPTIPADPALVRDILGLTLGEARVAALVGSGLPPKEAAQKLGLSEETVRTALKRVFSKTGISRQSELSALLTKLALRST